MCFSHKRVYLIPLDSRPVCYDMPRRLAQVAGVDLGMPAPNLLGHLKEPANFKTLSRWIKNHLFEKDPLIVALDTIAYGGLIASRVNEDPLEVLQSRVQNFFQQIKVDACFGFSSILRIPNYNVDEEEPAYWSQYGQALYRYSAQSHQTGQAPQAGEIPPAVLNDFLSRREKNFTLNESYLSLLFDGALDYLTFCQDDTGPYGLNVQEAQNLTQQIKKRKLDQAHIQTGADEVAACMLARWMVLQAPRPVKIYPFYSSEAGRCLVAKFDGLPIETVVEKAIRACGAQVAKKSGEADLWLMIHTPEDRQGDHCSREQANVQPEQWTEVQKVLQKALQLGKPIALADVAYANGADPRLMERLVTHFEDLTGLYGYAAWNTPGNTIGTTVAMGLVRLMAERNQCFNAQAFCQLMLIRLADDWLYQADVRHTVRQKMNGTAQSQPPDETLLNVLMADGLFLLKNRLGLEKQNIHCRYPCQRTFEIEMVLK